MLREAVDYVKKSVGLPVEKKAITLSDPAIADIFGIIPTASGVPVTASTALRVPAVLQAVRLISETVGSLPVKVYQHAEDGKEVAKDHPAYRLLHDRANPWTGAGQLRTDLTADALLHGAGYAQVIRASDGRPLELHRLEPGRVQCRTEDDGEPYYVVSGKNRQSVRLHYADVIYLPAFRDTSPVSLGKEAIGLAVILERDAVQLFASGRRPNAILYNDKPSGEGVGAKTIDNIKKAFRLWRAEPYGDPLPLDGGWKYEQQTMTSTDSQFLENRVEQVREIGRVFGVPPSMLYELSRSTWSNAEQMAATFLQLCLRPWLDRWQDAYTTALMADDTDHFPEFIVDDLQRTDATARADIFGKLIAMRVMAPNEVRGAMNLPALPGGDELMNPNITTTTPANSKPDTTEQKPE